jgi:Protein of unknown function (DUF2911)
MLRSLYWLILGVFSLTVCVNVAAESSVSDANTTCNFGPTKQIAVDYERVQLSPGKKVLGSSVPYGKVWAPGGKPLTLFTNTPISVGNENVADGAYTMFIIPQEKSWTLIISKSTDTSGRYDKAQDLARIPLECYQLPEAEPAFTAYFAHVADNQCNLRLDLGDSRASVAIRMK